MNVKDGTMTSSPDPMPAVAREVQSGGARRRRDAVLRADVRSDGLLELCDLRPLRHPAALDRIERRTRLGLAERRLGDRDVELLAGLGRHRYLPAVASAVRRHSISLRTPSASFVSA